ncbi:MAG: aconitase/3-isopropylmalate dehydratase large subunit family protein [Candidatus Thermoplasmatota archaeon]|jgi:3-isopropylmalate/(R)-2-methylmalate dehydratase large subunit|nr:aconitase/3-isopropylmalate dehydratase large subunit family protein [Candidatus Thermoplasmatota archaeon]MCL5963235.1 aconitase/3-isopropylmalate dehydratase large subunit family protein [Candidatus Thermoplasmatota archaeon]
MDNIVTGNGFNGTLAEKIFSYKLNKQVYSKDEYETPIDLLMMSDASGILALKEIRDKIGIINIKPWDSKKIVMVFDHFTPPANPSHAMYHSMLRKFADAFDINYYDIGEGISHQLLIERELAKPGMLIAGADSHSTSYGAVGAMGVGIGSTDAIYAMMKGSLLLKVPESIKIVLNGQFKSNVYGKDLILYILGNMKADGATYMCTEYWDYTEKGISLEDRITITNMGAELGAKASIFSIDNQMIKKYGSEVDKYRASEDARYNRVMNFNVSDIEPMIAVPDKMDNVFPVSRYEGVKIEQAFIGSCTNGRITDMRIAARILKGKKVAKNVRLLIAPASAYVYEQMIKEHLIDLFVEAGAVILIPGCGPCFGALGGLLSSDETVISSSNRNFSGRMGSAKARIFISSPATVAISAVNGYISIPSEVNTE